MNLEEIVRSQLLYGADLKKSIADRIAPEVASAARLAVDSLKNGGKIMLAGNGGSAADAQHLAAELMGRFEINREPLPAVALTTDTSILTAIGNDFGFDTVFSKQVEGLARAGDVFVAISTSGNSPNILAAVDTAHAKGAKVVGLTGGSGGKLASISDVAIIIPDKNTARIQECHIAVGHIICYLVEKELFGR